MSDLRSTIAGMPPRYEDLCPDPDKMCVHQEKYGEDAVPARSARVIHLTDVKDDSLVYEGDIDGDGARDRFEGFFGKGGGGTGTLFFGRADGTREAVSPTRFLNADGRTIAVGDKVTVTDVDGSRHDDKVTGFRILVGSPYGQTRPDYAYVTVQAVLASLGLYNVDHLAPAGR